MDEHLHPALSQLFVASLIEFDNAAETWLPHRTTALGDGGPPTPAPRSGHTFRRPWLVSATTWQNLLRIVAGDGLPQAVAETSGLGLAGVRRWGYARLDGDRLVLRWPGKVAHRVWSELEPAIEARWRERWGAGRIDDLRDALEPLAGTVTSTTPRSMPQLGYADGGRTRMPLDLGPGEPIPARALDLGSLLARALLRCTLAYERGSELTAVLGFDVIEPLADAGGELTRTELVARSGVAPEAMASFVGRLERSEHVRLRRAGRSVVIGLTARGALAAAEHVERAAAAEARVAADVGGAAVARLRAVVAAVHGDATALRRALEPSDGGWRSRPPYAAQTERVLADPHRHLPRHPAVTHRGGFPDGA
ncbi:MAG: hypothetical protein FWD85_11420 [Microbacteriaceae bacterium]|nr:hypothetical protein [Microbacteriaceae bacterium]